MINNLTSYFKPDGTPTPEAIRLFRKINSDIAAGGGGGGGGASWGTITGTLSAQTDLQSALNARQPLATVLTNTTAAFTTAQETKLSGIATGATANATDAALRDRATHTGTQAASTITGLATVATSGAYADLSGLPSLFNGAYSSLSGIPSTFAPSAHTHPLSDLTQSGATTGQVAAWNGSAWAPATVSGGGGATDFFSQSFASQGPGFATDTYLTGSSILIPSAGVKVGTRYILRFRASKTAAGTATPVINIRFGTAQTTADASRLTFTLRAQTAAADEGIFDVEVAFTAAGATATLGGIAFARHRQTTTGFQNAVTGEQVSTGAAFDSTVANSYIGASVNGGASAAWTVTFKSAMLLGTN